MEFYKETKPKVSKYYAYYKLWVDVNKQRNKAIYLLFINCNIKRNDLAKIFSISSTRIKQIIDKQERINKYSGELHGKKTQFAFFDTYKDREKRKKRVANTQRQTIAFRISGGILAKEMHETRCGPRQAKQNQNF